MFTEMFAQSGAELVGVDISAELLEKARQRGLPAGRVRFLEKRFEEGAVHGPFDAVIGSSGLHYLDIRAAMRRISELLEPGRIISFAEPKMLKPQIMIQKNVPWIKQRLGDSPDETALCRWPFRQVFAEDRFRRPGRPSV